MIYLLISILRATGLFALFICSWLVAYAIGKIVVMADLMDCGDPGSCELTVGIIIMPLGGTALYILTLVIWALSARKHSPFP